MKKQLRALFCAALVLLLSLGAAPAALAEDQIQVTEDISVSGDYDW